MQFEQKLSEVPASLAYGSARFAGRAWLAPMSGITDLGMRRVALDFGAGAVVSEMVAADAYLGGKFEARLRAEGEGITPHIVQIAGCEPVSMADAARLAEASGAHMIDINMGCPAKRVTGGWSGSALMRDLDHATRLIEATVQAVSVPVSVKMRLGWDESALNAPELARRAEATGVGLVTVHGRTRQQFYKGEANWAAIARVRDAFSGILVANGDIGSVSDARTCLKASGADAVMIGRAATGRPWLVGEIAAALDGRAWQTPSPDAMAAAASAHYDYLIASMGVPAGTRHARKHLAAYAEEAVRHGAMVPALLRTELVTATDPDRVRTLLAGLFEPVRYGAVA